MQLLSFLRKPLRIIVQAFGHYLDGAAVGGLPIFRDQLRAVGMLARFVDFALELALFRGFLNFLETVQSFVDVCRVHVTRRREWSRRELRDPAAVLTKGELTLGLSVGFGYRLGPLRSHTTL